MFFMEKALGALVRQSQLLRAMTFLMNRNPVHCFTERAQQWYNKELHPRSRYFLLLKLLLKND